MRPFRNSSESSSVNLLMYFRVPRTLFSRQSFMSIFKKKWMKTRNYLISGLGFPKMLPAVTNRWQNLQFYNRRKKSSGLLRSTRWGGYEGRRSSKRSLACCRIQVCAFLCQTFSGAVQAWNKSRGVNSYSKARWSVLFENSSSSWTCLCKKSLEYNKMYLCAWLGSGNFVIKGFCWRQLFFYKIKLLFSNQLSIHPLGGETQKLAICLRITVD